MNRRFKVGELVKLVAPPFDHNPETVGLVGKIVHINDGVYSTHILIDFGSRTDVRLHDGDGRLPENTGFYARPSDIISAKSHYLKKYRDAVQSRG